MAKKATNIYELMPRNVSAVGINTKESTVVALTKKFNYKINVQLDMASFRHEYCGGCPHFMSNVEIKEALKAENRANIPVNIINYCTTNNKCNASNQLIPSCTAGNVFTDMIPLEVAFPSLLWVHRYDKTSKEAWRLFQPESGADNKIERVKPFRLGNVYLAPTGAICWPKSTPKPKNLRQAIYAYLTSPFNADLMPRPTEDISILTAIKDYDVSADTSTKWEELDVLNSYDTIWLDADQNYDGIFYTDSAAVINSLPDRVTKGQESLLGYFKQGEGDNWLFYINDYLLLKAGKLSGTSKLKVLSKV